MASLCGLLTFNLQTMVARLTDEWIKKMWFMYTMEYYSAIKKARNNVICSNIDESRRHHATCSKWESKRHISYHITFKSYLKIDTSEDISTEKGNHRFIKQTYGSPNGKVWGLDTSPYWGEQRYTNTREIYNHQRPTEIPREDYSTLCHNLHGKRFQRRIDICICVKEPHLAHLEQTNHCNRICCDKEYKFC